MPVLLLVANYLILTINHKFSGDLGRMGRTFYEKGYHGGLDLTPDTLFVGDVEIENVPDSAQTLCFGDSFSNLRPYSYLQPLGERTGVPVLNVLYNLDYSPEEAALSFLTNAPSNKMPSVLVVETVERDFIPRVLWLDFDNALPIDQLQVGKRHFGEAPRRKAIEEMALYYRRRFGIGDTPVLRTRLESDCFTAKGKEDLLLSYYRDTIHYPDDYRQGVVENLERLHGIAAQRGVELFYVPAPNKTTIYAPFVKGHHHFYSALDGATAFDTIPFLLNPMDTLRAMVARGVPDVYYADDTHWSPAAASVVGRLLATKISEQSSKTRNN